MGKPYIRVRRNGGILRRDNSCQVSVGCDESSYTITGFEGKSNLKITDFSGQILTEVSYTKAICKGVVLGDDVLRLTVEARADRSLVMALATLYGLISGKL
ncbi:hypothetical protein SASPL_143198 [Salvia splendens]|uniref:Uncharacterized protein n=1 Tax=Salvia splendens TaxID=180675 RepID=A0A8X8ZA55_SALSN|nr:hypothetical protein SASPL_143198 [Salvia splendens]